MWRGEGVGGGGREDSGGDRRDERTDHSASDVGDSTFAVPLHGDFHVGRGDVALPSVLLPRPRPAVPFVLLDDVQHLRRKRKQAAL